MARTQEILPEEAEKEDSLYFDPLNRIRKYLDDGLRQASEENYFQNYITSQLAESQMAQVIDDVPIGKVLNGTFSMYVLEADSRMAALSAEHGIFKDRYDSRRPGWNISFEKGDEKLFQVTVDKFADLTDIGPQNYERRDDLERIFYSL